MKKKLSNDEIEERKKQNMLETAKMNSCISGKTLSDLIDSTSHRGNYGDKDCMVKQMFLKNLVEPVTSRELYESLKRQGYSGKYNTFKGLLNRYQEYEYVQKLNDKKPYLYQVTDKGWKHARNPYIARDELARKRMQFIYSQIETELIDHPEALKNLIETISGMNSNSDGFIGVSSGGNYNQFSNNDYGNSEELKQELNTKIFDNEFFKNADEGKLKTLVDGILKGSLTTEEREQLLLDALQEAVNTHKGSMVLNREYQSSKPDGDRKYYSLLVNCINKPVTKSVYDKIPFVFIFVSSKNELRLESESIAGRYRKNKDAIFIDFELVNQRFFHNNMQIKTKNNGKELEFFYSVVDGKGTWGFNRKITTMSFSDYQKAVNKSSMQKMKINTQKDV